MEKKLLFVVDQDRQHRDLLDRWLTEEGYEVTVFDSGEACLNMLDRDPAVICLDLMMPDMNGVEILKKINSANRDIPVIVVTSNKNLDLAVQTMKVGDFDYLLKPVSKIRLCTNIEKAIAMHSLVHQINQLRGELKKTYSYKNLVGQSEGMRQVFSQIENVTKININVFIHGESGTGKELVARAIHYGSAYRKGNFVDINCGAIPEELQESEFFGHEKGAFTGADRLRKGKMEVADGGTVFLDEVAELTPKSQVKLLRFLQDKSFERVGGNKKIHVDLRIISATNKNLEKAVAQEKFREDLYYRLMVYPIFLPPLRKRKEDIPPLVNHFLKKYKNEIPNIVTTVSADAMEVLMKCDWPGNIRQLENVIFRGMVTTKGDTIFPENLPRESLIAEKTPVIREPVEAPSPIMSLVKTGATEDEIPSFREIEKQALHRALQSSGGNIPKAAKRLGISRATFYRKIKKYSLS